MSLDYEFAPIDVSIMTHPKACAAGPEAMGLWLWGQTYAKHHGTDGRLHRAAVLAAWGGRRNIMLAKRLEDAGLWLAREDGDWDIYNFGRKSPGMRTRGSEPPRSSTDRVRLHRSKKKAEVVQDETHVTETETGETRFGNGNGSPSPSPSPSPSVSSGEVQEGARVLRPDEPLTDQRRNDHEASAVPPRAIDPEWRNYVDDRIARSMLFGSPGAIDADWRKWVRRQNAYDAKARQNGYERGRRADTRQPLGDPNAKWLKTGSDL